MDLGQGFHGLQATTPDNLLLDAGILYANIDEAALQGSTPSTAFAAAVKIGATRGNSSFASGKQTHAVDANGVRYPTKGMLRIDGWTPTLTATILEMSRANLEKVFAHVTSTTHPHYKELQLSVEVADADYLTNIALVAKKAGSETPCVLVLRNALMLDAVDIAMADKGEATCEAKFVAHALLSAPHDSPFSCYYPEEEGS